MKQPPPATTESDGFRMIQREPEQPALFATEELVIPEVIRTFRKAVAAIHATPLSADHNHTLNSRRLFDACILAAQIDVRSRGPGFMERVRSERVSPRFEISVGELSKLANISGKSYQRIYDALMLLYEMDLQWNVVGEDGEVEWKMRAHFLSSFGVGTGRTQGLIRFSLDPAVLDIVLEPRNWATLSLAALKDLRTGPSYALFQSTWRYINTSAKVTAALPTETWIELLLGKSRYVQDSEVLAIESGTNSREKKVVKTVVDYGDFKRRILLEAIQRVNDIKALGHTLELREIRAGRRVAKLQFKFVPKKQEPLGLPVRWPEEVQQLLRAIGFTAGEMQDLAEAYSYENLTDALLRLEAAERSMRAKGRAIAARKAYFEGILRNVAGAEAQAAFDEEALERQVRAEEAERANSERRRRLQEEFSLHQVESLRKGFIDLNAQAREQLIEAFEATEDGARTKLLTEKSGWVRPSAGVLTMLRTWLARERPAQLAELLPDPEDREFDAWLAWRVETGGRVPS